MQCVDTTEIAKLSDALESVLKELPEMRKKVHEEIGADILKIVRKNIGRSINDAHGKIRGWQENYVGSRGGYAAVRPIGGKGPKSYDDSPGAITNYLEVGHTARDGGVPTEDIFTEEARTKLSGQARRERTRLWRKLQRNWRKNNR